MKIAIVHSFYRSNTPSGENSAVVNQVRLLRDAGNEVLLVSKDSDSISALESVKLGINVATLGGLNPIQAITDFTPDVVHIHNTFPSFGQLWINDLKIPYVVTLHNFRPLCAAGTLSRNGKDCFECPEKGSHRAILHACYRDSKIASIPLAVASRKSGAKNPILTSKGYKIVLSKFAKEVYERFSPTSRNLVVLPNFAEKTSRVNNFQPARGQRHWVFIGRLSEEKGIKELLEAWPNQEQIHVYGSGPLEEYLKLEFSGRSNILFKGMLSPENRGEILQRAEGLLFPSTCRENSPMVIGEAYSAGIPVIAYASNVVGEAIALDGGGAVFHNFKDLGKVLEDFDSIRSNQLQVVRSLYETTYSPESWLERILSIYKSAILSSKRENF